MKRLSTLLAALAFGLVLEAAPEMMTSRAVAAGEYLVFGQLRPEYQQEIVKHAGLQVIHADGAVTLRLKETDRAETKEGAAKHLVIRLADEARALSVTRHIRSWNDCDAVETWVEIVHDEKGPVQLVKADSFATALKVPSETVKVLSLTGVWGHEGNVSESPIGKGQIVELSSKSGVRDAWESNTAMMLSFGEQVDEEHGQVLGVALEWTGTTCRRVRRAWDGSFTEVFAGVDMTTGPYVLDPGKVFTTPKAILVWSEKGKGEVSRQLHRWARNHCLPHGRELHPVLLNSWEGSYFSFTEKTLTDMMDGVKEMGGEMFVLDDGWFGKGKYARDEKNKDRVGLGDWYVNRAKLPHGLGWLADEAGKRGLKFGLWVEPEMCNTTSWLAEEHPEWILREEGRPLALGRGWTQVVLDMANPAVRERLFTMLDKVYSDIPTLAYIKWDANQNISNPGSTYLAADRQPNLWYDYTIGLYDLLAKFQAKRPQIMVQACASGGGHMDYGFLRYADEFWTSDNTDPLARVFMQWGALQFYPACAMACHVTASPNHMTKRVTPLKYRFDVAMCGRMGFELHPKDLKPEEIAFAKAAVADYKQIRPIVQQGDLYRLASPYENTYAALQYVNESETCAAVFILGLDTQKTRTAKVVLRGLDPARTYEVREASRGTRLHGAFDGVERTGEQLMKDGLAVELAGEYDSAVLTVLASAATGVDEYDEPVRPVGVNGQPAWNVAARQFMYAPTFGFEEIPGAVRYRFEVAGAGVFEAERPTAALTPVWAKVPVGDVTVSVTGIAADGTPVGSTRTRRFWKMPPFREGAYPKATRGYTETAALIWSYVFNRPYLAYMLEKGEPDPKYPLNSYPAKMLASQIWAMLRYAKLSPQDAPRAMKIAKAAADRLIARAQPPGRPLAFFPPTYDGRGEAGNDYLGEKFKGMHMLHYPSAAGMALLDYAEASGETRYRDFAVKIADTYVKLQGEDGTWWLKMDECDGKPVCKNRLVPIRVLEFLERVAKLTGESKYARAAERAFGFIEKGPLTDWNWEGQFEDIYPAPLYANLTKHGACDVAIYLLRRFPGDTRRLAQARELLRWSEDQFMVWDNRYNQSGVEKWTTPVVLEQYHCYAPIDESAAKLMMTYLALYRAERNPRDLAKARALGDAFTRVTLDDGRLRTYWNTDRRDNEHEDWVNGQVVSALALEDLARDL